VSVAAASA